MLISRWRLACQAVLLMAVFMPAATAMVGSWRDAPWSYELAVVGRLDTAQHEALTASRTDSNGETFEHSCAIGSITVTEVIMGPKDLEHIFTLLPADSAEVVREVLQKHASFPRMPAPKLE
jgi:hypothetical protein